MRDKKYILLEGIELGNRFFTTNDTHRDQTKGYTGETWYRVLGYADTIEEAQRKLYGVSFA